MASRTLCAAALIVLTLIAGCEGASPTPTPVPPTATTAALLPLSGSGGGRIAFSSKRDGNYEIYVMNADGKNLRRLTNSNSIDVWPSWSPDGQKIFFVSAPDESEEIYVMDADGKNPLRLTNNNASDRMPNCLDPAVRPVSPAGELRVKWGWIKQNSK